MLDFAGVKVLQQCHRFHRELLIVVFFEGRNDAHLNLQTAGEGGGGGGGLEVGGVRGRGWEKCGGWDGRSVGGGGRGGEGVDPMIFCQIGQFPFHTLTNSVSQPFFLPVLLPFSFSHQNNACFMLRVFFFFICGVTLDFCFKPQIPYVTYTRD